MSCGTNNPCKALSSVVLVRNFEKVKQKENLEENLESKTMIVSYFFCLNLL